MIKSFGYYGTVGDQVNETRGTVNRLWVCNFDGSREKRKENILSAGVPVTLDVSECLFPSFGTLQPKDRTKRDITTRDTVLPEARQNLLQMEKDLGNAWDYVDSIVLIDEPNLKYHAKPASLAQAAALVRNVWPDKKLAVIYTSGKPIDIELFDMVGFDDYKRGDRSLWDWFAKYFGWLPYPKKWGRAYRIQKEMRPDAELILVPGGAEPKLKPATIEKWVKYAKKQKRPVHIIAFLWRNPSYETGLQGIVEQPELKEKYLKAGRNIVV